MIYVFGLCMIDFVDEILVKMNGEGVDLVINLLVVDFIVVGMCIVRFDGVFVEIGK